MQEFINLKAMVIKQVEQDGIRGYVVHCYSIVLCNS